MIERLNRYWQNVNEVEINITLIQLIDINKATRCILLAGNIMRRWGNNYAAKTSQPFQIIIEERCLFDTI